MEMTSNRIPSATAEIENLSFSGQARNKTVVPKLVVSAAVAAIGLPGERVLLVVIDDGVGEISHAVDMASGPIRVQNRKAV